MDILLNGQNWFIKGFWPWVPVKDKSMETGQELMGVTDWIPATVPGGVHYDLFRAGLIEYPYFDMDSLKCEWVENRWWIYRTEFKCPDITGSRFELVFKGLDYYADIFLNGEHLGTHEGMYEPAVFDITRIIKQNENLELKVLFKSPPEEMGQIGKTSLTFTQKSRFNYKWDFSTRLVNTGIWDDVLLRVHRSCTIDDVYITTDTGDDKGNIKLQAKIIRNNEDFQHESEDLILSVTCKNPQSNSIIHRRLILGNDTDLIQTLLEIDNPQLWYPNGYGGQPLYEIRLELNNGNDLLDERTIQTGIRSLEYIQNEDSPKDALPYTVVLNNKKIYIKGVNITPLDHLYGNVTPSQYEWMLLLMKHANVNMVRVWGGGIIEKEIFYELCDKYGIMIWQEFIQSSSGIDNIPSKRPEFLSLLERTAISALKGRRSYVSLTVWSGGNELMSETNKPSTYEDTNIALLKSLVEKYNSSRLFLPTSASGPSEFITTKKGVSHDIHGHWHYQGNPGHYSLYGQSDSLFHSEFGVDGICAVKSIKKFLSHAHHYPTPMRGNIVWRHHGEWWGTFFRDRELFEQIGDINTFAGCSQWIQAEGIRFIIESNCRRQFRNSGSIVWQLNEPWPNVSCTSLVDYYGEAKMAYYSVRKAFAPIHVSLEYTRLNYQIGEYFDSRIFVDGNYESRAITVSASVIDIRGNVLFSDTYKGELCKERSVELGKLCLKVTQEYSGLFFVRLELLENEVSIFENLYIFSTEEGAVYSRAMSINEASLSVISEGEWVASTDKYHTFDSQILERNFSILNTGNEAVLHIYPEETTNAYWMVAEDAFVSLFPGESRQVIVRCIRKQAGGFLCEDQLDLNKNISEPTIEFKYFPGKMS